MNRSSEIMWVHVIRVVAIFLVLCIHSVAEVFFLGAKFDTFEWWVGNVYDSMFRVCVPLLFMITGYLLLQGSEPIGVFLKKRVRKVLVPLFVWSVFFLLWINLYEYQHPSPASTMTPETLKSIHDGGWRSAVIMLWSPIYYHLWFLYVIFGAYLVMPLLRILVQHAQTQQLWYFVLLSLLGTGILPLLSMATQVRSNIDLRMVSGTVGYMVLGHLLGNLVMSRKLIWSVAALGLFSLVFTIVGTYSFTVLNKGELSQVLWGDAPNVTAMTVAAFLVIRYLAERCDRLQSGAMHAIVKTLSNASFGIYLVHVMFLYAFAEGIFGFRLTALSGNPALFVPLLVLLTYACSFTVVYCMQKLPLVRHAVP